MANQNLISVAIVICLASLTNAVAIVGSQGGVNTATGQRPFRQEISTFKDSGPAFDLYILSLQQFQQQNQSALLSYYQVGGNKTSASVQRTIIDLYSRHSWTPLHCLGWCPRFLSNGVLHAQFYPVPIVASTLRGTFRGSIASFCSHSQLCN